MDSVVIVLSTLIHWITIYPLDIISICYTLFPPLENFTASKQVCYHTNNLKQDCPTTRASVDLTIQDFIAYLIRDLPLHLMPFPEYPDGQGPQVNPVVLAGGGLSVQLTPLKHGFPLKVQASMSFSQNLPVYPAAHVQPWTMNLLSLFNLSPSCGATHWPSFLQAHILMVGVEIAEALNSSFATNVSLI